MCPEGREWDAGIQMQTASATACCTRRGALGRGMAACCPEPASAIPVRRHIQNLYKALPSPPAAFLSVAPCGESDALYGSSADDCSLRQRWRLSTPDGHGKTAKPSSVAVNIQVQALPGGQVGVGCLPAGINRQRQPGGWGQGGWAWKGVRAGRQVHKRECYPADLCCSTAQCMQWQVQHRMRMAHGSWCTTGIACTSCALMPSHAIQSVVRSPSGSPLCESYAATIVGSCLSTSGYIVNSATAAAAKWVIKHAGGSAPSRFYIRMPVRREDGAWKAAAAASGSEAPWLPHPGPPGGGW